MFGQQVDTLSQKLLTLLPLLTGQTDNGTFSPCTAVIGIELQALVQRLHSLCCIFLEQIDLCLHRVGTSIFRPMGNHRIYLHQRLVIVLVLNQTKNAVVPESLIFRIITQCSVIILYCLSIFLLIDATKTTKLVGTHHIGIALDGFRTVIFCPSVIIEIEFGHTTKKPRLKEPRLLTDGLIKILNRQDVILVIERRTSYHDQTVCIKLGIRQYRPNDQKI